MSFYGLLVIQIVPKTYYNMLSVEILIWDQNNFGRVTSQPKNPFKVSIYAKLVIDLVFSRSDFLGLVGAPNESLRLIIIYYMIKYSFRIQKTLLGSNLEPKKRFKGSI